MSSSLPSQGTMLLGGYGVIVIGMALNNGAAGVGGSSPPGMPPMPEASSS